MAYNLGSLVTEVQTKTKDTTFPASLIKMYIQDTADEVLGHNRFPFSEETLTAPIATNDTEYEFPATLQSITDVSLILDSQPDQVYRPTFQPYREFQETWPNRLVATAQTPIYYTLYGNKLLFSAPVSEAGDLYFLYLLASPTLSNDADVPIIPVEFKQILVRGGMAGVEEYRENYDQAALHRRKVEDLTDDMLQRYVARQFITTSKSTLNRRRGISKDWAYGPK